MARAYQDTQYRGRRRLAGNFGKLYINNVEVFEIKSYEAKITADREDIIIGQSKDSKIVSLTGEGSLTIVQVFNRGMRELMRNWQAGYDERFTFVGVVSDPDAVQHQVEQVRLENVWVNELPIMNFEKGSVIEKEFTFGWTPEDTDFESVISIADESVTHEENGGY